VETEEEEPMIPVSEEDTSGGEDLLLKPLVNMLPLRFKTASKEHYQTV
jgi:hypothetical protein